MELKLKLKLEIANQMEWDWSLDQCTLINRLKITTCAMNADGRNIQRTQMLVDPNLGQSGFTPRGFLTSCMSKFTTLEVDPCLNVSPFKVSIGHFTHDTGSNQRDLAP